jgi:hypothetical protein
MMMKKKREEGEEEEEEEEEDDGMVQPMLLPVAGSPDGILRINTIAATIFTSSFSILRESKGPYRSSFLSKLWINRRYILSSSSG